MVWVKIIDFLHLNNQIFRIPMFRCMIIVEEVLIKIVITKDITIDIIEIF